VRGNAGGCVIQFQFVDIFGKSHKQTATVGTILHDFTHIAVGPVDEDGFQERPVASTFVLGLNVHVPSCREIPSVAPV
jgi:hypothetical protein